MPNSLDLQSLGYAASIYQRDPRLIENAIIVAQAERALAAGERIPHEARPALRLNGLAYYSADDIVAAVGWMATRGAEQARAEAEASANG